MKKFHDVPFVPPLTDGAGFCQSCMHLTAFDGCVCFFYGYNKRLLDRNILNIDFDFCLVIHILEYSMFS